MNEIKLLKRGKISSEKYEIKSDAKKNEQKW